MPSQGQARKFLDEGLSTFIDKFISGPDQVQALQVLALHKTPDLG